jgi:hypothetical protein
MLDLDKKLLKWDDLRLIFIVRSTKKIKTGNPIADDVLTRIFHWTTGPLELKLVVLKFLYAISKGFPSDMPFTILEMNLLKFYIGQWISGMADQPLRWDERLDKITTPKELFNFLVWIQEYGIDPL